MRSCRQGLFPTLDSVVYNDSIFNGDTQGNPIFARFLVSLQHLSIDSSLSTAPVFPLQYNKKTEKIFG